MVIIIYERKSKHIIAITSLSNASTLDDGVLSV